FVEIDSVPLRDNSPSDKFPEESKRSRTDIYLDTYCKLFPCGESLTPKTLLVGLTDLGFDRIDTGLLRLLAHPLSNQAGNPDPPNEENSVRLLTLYRNICDSFFSSDTDKLNEAAEWVYRFSLMSGENCMIENHFRKAQVFLCTHESILDYMTARHHLSLLLDSNPEKNAIAMSHVLPRSIMRFFVAMVNENAGKKEKILKQLLNQLELDLPSDLDEKKEDFLTCIQMIPAKRASQLLYLLGRVETDGAQTALEKCYHLLRLCVARLQKNKKHLELSRSAEYKTMLYLLRSATVGLISRGIRTVRISNNTFEDLTEEDNSLSNAPSPEFAVQYPVWDDYLDLLITDGSANEINRAFYLEYYEDVPVDPSANAVSFSDNLEKGRHAIEHLLSATLIRKSHQANATHSYRLNLFSLVSLLQARTEDPTRQDYYPLDNYVSAALDRISFFTKHAHKIENEENHSGRFTKSLLDQFMCMVEADFKWWLDTSPSDRRPITAQLYSRYSTQVIRQNWTWDWNLAQQKAEKTTRNTVEPDPAAVHEAQTLMSGTSPVPVHPESVAEHQLRDWLIAMFYLPEHYEAERPRQYSTDSVYKKAKILKLLLIHDLSEAVVGNRARLRKNRTSQEIERKEMMSLLLHCSYPSLSGSTLVEYLKIWPAWIDYEEPKNQNNPRQYRDINGDIAYQIDCIQELYQLLTYYSADQISLPLNKLREWVISDARRIRSAPCKQIAKLLILRDPRLRKILDNNQLTKFLE
ncbi:MAG: HD domain-containing protein, partial [Candidatus Faecousia sp.]|nr:HD domain-containing protein [Candidatus Faecousia sp.]